MDQAKLKKRLLPDPEAPNGGFEVGMRHAGNIDLNFRPRVKNPDGSTSTVRSMGIGTDEGEVLIPTVSEEGRIMSDFDAKNTFFKTRRHLGIFDTPEHATAYAKKIHEEQERKGKK
jgi:hypothetical protein